MNAKGSKNAIENRGARSVMMCSVCGQERKPVRVMTMGKNGMGYECKCGLQNKNGATINL